MKSLVKALLLLVIAALPTYVIRFNIFGFPSTALEILILLTFVIFFIQRMSETKFKVWKIFSRTNLDLPISLLLISAAFSLLITPDLRGGLGIYKAFFLEPAILFYMLTTFFRDVKSLALIVMAMLLSSIWVSALALFFLLAGSSPFSQHELIQGRLSAIYNSANALALYLGPVFCFALATCLFGKDENLLRQRSSLYFIFSSVTILLALIIVGTNSRGSIIAILTVIAFFLLFSMQKKFDFKYLALVPVAAFLLSFVSTIGAGRIADLTPKVRGSEFSEANTSQIRLYLFAGTGALLFDRPLFGAGLDGFKELYSNNYLLPQYREPLQYPHNFFLTVYSELGILGVFTFVFLFWQVFRKISNLDRVWNIALCASFLYILVHGLVDVPFFKNDLSTQFFALLSIVSIRGKLRF